MSTKYDGRIEELEKKLGEAGKLPKSARGPYLDFIGADDGNPIFPKSKLSSWRNTAPLRALIFR